MYFSSKSISCIVYDKELERRNKGKSIDCYEKNILRFEVKILKRHLQYIEKKYQVWRGLENYIVDEKYKKYFIDNFKNILYVGNFYKISEVDKILDESNINKKDKKLLREFLISLR